MGTDVLGIQYVHMPAPEKLIIYDNKLSEPIVDWRLSPLYAWARWFSPPRMRMCGSSAARDQRPLFPKTDSHWNAEGAFIAYKSLCDRIGLVPDLTLLSRKRVDYHAVSTSAPK
jgi:hypothetical protein